MHEGRRVKSQDLCKERKGRAEAPEAKAKEREVSPLTQNEGQMDQHFSVHGARGQGHLLRRVCGTPFVSHDPTSGVADGKFAHRALAPGKNPSQGESRTSLVIIFAVSVIAVEDSRLLYDLR